MAGHQIFRILILLAVVLPTESASLPGAAQSIQTHAGQSVTLPCHPSLNKPVAWSFQPLNTIGVTFLYQGNMFINGHSTRFELDSYSLVILNPQMDDSGLYTCTENDGLGEEHSTRLDVTDRITETPLYVSFSGQEMRLPCRSTGAAVAIRWAFQISSNHDDSNTIHIACKDDTITPKFSERFALDKFTKGDHNLVIKSSHVNDSGEYKCFDDKGTSTSNINSVRLMVIYPERTVVAALRSEVSLGCNIYRPSSVNWTFAKNGSVSVVGGNPTLQTLTSHDGRISVLHIDTVDFTHGGKYSCTGEPGSTGAHELVVYEAVLSCTMSSNLDEFGKMDIAFITCHIRYQGNVHPNVICHVGNTGKSINLSRDAADGSFKASLSPSCDMDKSPFICTAAFNANSMVVIGPNTLTWNSLATFIIPYECNYHQVSVNASSMCSPSDPAEPEKSSVDNSHRTSAIVTGLVIGFIVGVIVGGIITLIVDHLTKRKDSLFSLATKKCRRCQRDQVAGPRPPEAEPLKDEPSANVVENSSSSRVDVNSSKSPTTQSERRICYRPRKSPPGSEVLGMWIDEDKLYVVREGRCEIEIYYKRTLNRVGELKITGEGNTEPCCAAFDKEEHAAYVTYHLQKIIRKINLKGEAGELQRKDWCQPDKPEGIAITPTPGVIVAFPHENKLVKFNIAGTILDTIMLDTTVKWPRFVAPFIEGDYLICYGKFTEGNCGVCLVNSVGEVQCKDESTVKNPMHIVVSPPAPSYVFVADCDGNQVVMFDSSITYVRNVFPEGCQFSHPASLCLDDSCGIMYIGERSQENSRIHTLAVAELCGRNVTQQGDSLLDAA